MSRSVLVTGASKGIGRAIACQLRQTALTLAFTITVTPRALRKR